jgi:hypothetical protein
MGYTTDFSGEFESNKPFSPEHKAYLKQFAYTRRMARDPKVAETLPDPLREAVKLPIGEEGGYYVGTDDNDFGQKRDESVLEHNGPPKGQPGLWCQWTPNEAGTAIEWDGGEKFYEYVAWLEYLIEHFLKPWGYVLNGSVTWQGEESDDRGTIHVRDNVVQAVDDVIVSPAPKWAGS